MVTSGAVERTLVLVKPDAVRRRLVGEILGRFERRGLDIDAMVVRRMDDRLADLHYAEHLTKPFYPGLRATPGTIRGDLATSARENLVHAAGRDIEWGGRGRSSIVDGHRR